jgi:hypothetical protein
MAVHGARMLVKSGETLCVLLAGSVQGQSAAGTDANATTSAALTWSAFMPYD